MDRTTQPSKEQVRAYMHQRERQHSPPPPPHEIRRLLGWATLAAQPPSPAVAGAADVGAAACEPGRARSPPPLPPLLIGQWTMWMTAQWLRCAGSLWNRN
ncbi:MAG: hypothetical protein V4754_20995 [Pseudomonadota bacterium]